MRLALATVVMYAAVLVQGLAIEREMDAKRLAEDLAPLKSKRLFEPSGTGPDLAGRSIFPQVQGLVAMTYSNGTLACYVQDSGCTAGDTNTADATTFSAMLGYTGQQAVTSVSLLPGWNLAVQKPTDPRGYFNGSSGSIDFGEVTVVEANETPGTYNTNGVSEGGIWKLNLLDGNAMSATWTNSDNTKVKLGFLMDYYGELYACADCAAFNYWQYSDGGAFDGYLYDDIDLYFVPQFQL